ncbi:BLUF domain-containing protein [Bradyrhizobium sp. STM 3809]|uniref:BLUF domain-containing protein n=1 Tax=Bradyrhizobium sp. STM 3809 TaxID=551936 RepID=UPI0002408C7D|nr:BLUF domain-containing protein [Bradyrhizobium sp. STM 3809]CCD99036.1 putative blue light photoreceptor [Bradyrhizobium sp. STM 3809]
MSDLYALVYVSRKTTGAQSDIDAILRGARKFNACCDITGALLFNDSNFAQLIEGPETAVKQAFQRIKRDPRHCDVKQLSFEPTQRRRFGEWSMAFVDSSQQLRELEPLMWSNDAASAERASQKILDLLITLVEHDEVAGGWLASSTPAVQA